MKIGSMITQSLLEYFMNKKYKSMKSMREDMGLLGNYFINSGYIITEDGGLFFILPPQTN